MNPYRYAISLRITHPSIDPVDITSALGMNPHRSWRAGEPRTTPKGNALEGRNRETYWTSGNIARGEWPGKELSTALNALLDQLSAHRSFFHRVCSEGGKVEFFVGWFFEENSGDVIDHLTMARMADLKIDLSLDIYPPDQPQASL